ncbi:MAG: hypothetical protein AAF495_12975 [Pseudomonadota bacterium]
MGMRQRIRRRLAASVALVALTAACAQAPEPAASEETGSQEEPIKVTIGGYYRSGFVVGQ